VREAHPTDGWQIPANVKDGVLLPAARSLDEKEEHLNACVRKLDIRFPAVVDGMDNKVELDYSGWPTRQYLIGKDGKIVYKGGPGPMGLKPPELEQAIRKLLKN
jgi:type I thyroxine 5'-deiodinase